MDTFSFTALGTHWAISVDGEQLNEKTKEDILGLLSTFETRFSRFLPDSEVNAFRTASAGQYPISVEFAQLLARADQLRLWTGGAFDPAVGSVLARAGYDAKLSLTEHEEMTHPIAGWTLKDSVLTIDGPVAFDLGGIGKGYAIDLVATFLLERGISHLLVEGGGDMYGTKKADGSGWRVAVQWPGKNDVAASIITLRDQGFAASDTLLRRWGKWHHIIDMRTATPVMDYIGAAVVAPTAFDADSMTSALFLVAPNDAPALKTLFRASAMRFLADDRVEIDHAWPGELFS